MISYTTPTVSLEELRATLNRDYCDSSCFLLVDENSRKHCLPLLYTLDHLLNLPASIQNAQIIEIPSGEQHKNLQTFIWIIEQLIEKQADRKSLLINVGGGLVCDMGGFVATCYKRGIDFFNIPTTLLAMVDATHGGKTGINFENLKNQIGVFAPAKAVAIHLDFLNTLPKEEILSGFAEMIKMALITSVDFWKTVKKADLTDFISIKPLVLEAIEKKKRIVNRDPVEKSIRKVLNFGHTFGHAFETLALENKRDLSHGHAVAMGILCELWLSEKILNFDTIQREEITNFILSKYPKFPIQEADFPRLIEILLQDKKNSHQEIKSVLLEKIGYPQLGFNCSEELCLEAFRAYIAL